MKFTIDCIQAACEATCTVWLEFPEDLGSSQAGDPASLWQLEACQNLRTMGAQRGAIFQCEWAQLDYMKPTGILTNSTHLIDDPRFHKGWPTFKQSPGSTWRVYTGPLPTPKSSLTCKHGHHPPLRGRTAEKAWKMSATAAYPPELCHAMAAGLLQSEIDINMRIGPARAPTLSTGTKAAAHAE